MHFNAGPAAINDNVDTCYSTSQQISFVERISVCELSFYFIAVWWPLSNIIVN